MVLKCENLATLALVCLLTVGIAANAAVPQPQGVVDLPQPQGVVNLPQHQGVVNLPQHQGVVHLPQPQGVVNLPQLQGVVNLPQHQGVVNLPQPQGVVHLPQHQGVVNLPHPQGVVNLPQNQPQFIVIDARHPLNMALLNQHLPLQLQHTLAAISQATLPNILLTSPIVPQVSPLTSSPTLSPAINQASTSNLSEDPSIPQASTSTISQFQPRTHSESLSTTVSGASDASVSQTLDTSSSQATDSAQALTQEISRSSALLSAFNSIPGILSKATELAAKSHTSSTDGNENASPSLSQPLTVASQSPNIITETASSNTPLPSSSSTPTASTISTPTTTPLSDITDGAITVSSVDNETVLAATEFIDATSQIVSTTVGSTDFTEETSVLSVEGSTSVDSTSSTDSSTQLDQQKPLPSIQFSARSGLGSDSALAETTANPEQEVEAAVQSADSASVQVTMSERTRVMPSAEEVTARRLATIALQMTSPSTSAPTAISATSTTTNSATITVTTSTTTPIPVTSATQASSRTKTPGTQAAAPAVPNNLNSITKVFQSISRAAARNVAKVAALAQSRAQGFGMEPIVVGATEGAVVNQIMGDVHQGPEAMHMTISSLGTEDHQHRQVQNHHDLVTEMVGNDAVSPSP